MPPDTSLETGEIICAIGLILSIPIKNISFVIISVPILPVKSIPLK